MLAVAGQICCFEDCRHVNCVYVEEGQQESTELTFECEQCGRRQPVRTRAFEITDEKPEDCGEATPSN
jgi:hypothetical protein